MCSVSLVLDSPPEDKPPRTRLFPAPTSEGNLAWTSQIMKLSLFAARRFQMIRKENARCWWDTEGGTAAVLLTVTSLGILQLLGDVAKSILPMGRKKFLSDHYSYFSCRKLSYYNFLPKSDVHIELKT